ncbi:GH25 family lysozyme [Micromonospora sp. MW-13]|uniref:GH25 family lysozyme n=1 Tax=Micromonospora sp. MW-13 TaxID=2094022 RepID=UPI001FB24D2A|nr:GH25 family lysozyme [Micromonospora sp. MW-13]
MAPYDWSTAWANGARFAYVKATEGTGYTNPYFAQQYEYNPYGATCSGLSQASMRSWIARIV